MEDPPVSENFPADIPDDMPEGGADPDDPLRPEIDEENEGDAPVGAPNLDVEATEDVEQNKDVDEEIDDHESELSEVDEAQFDDFDPANIDVEDRPAVAVDDSNVGLLGVHKRKRVEGEDGERKKKRKEGRREKVRKHKKRGEDDEDNLEGGPELDGKRRRQRKEGEAAPRRKQVVEEDESTLTPEERRKRALDRAMDEAIKGPNKRRSKKDGIDLEAMGDAEIEEMRNKMSDAAQADTQARDRGEPAMHKLRLLPAVVSLLNRNTLSHQIVDPDINLLQSVRFFLEPLNDGSLPAYNIQRDIFAALQKLPINKDALIASGIGKVVMFYTKSKKPEPQIKRIAERLMKDWTRPIVNRTDDYRKKETVMADYDPSAAPTRAVGGLTDPAARAAMRERALAMPRNMNRAIPQSGVGSYTIAPKSNTFVQQQYVRAPGQAGDDAFRKIKMKVSGKSKR